MWRTLLRSFKKALTSALASMGRVRISACSCAGCDFRMRPRRTRANVIASSIARRGEAGARACKWKGRLCLIGADDCTGSTSRAAQMFASELGPKGRASGWCCCHLEYSVRKSKARECCRYDGSTTALSRASRGSCTRRSHASSVTNENSRFFEMSCSWAKWSNRATASRKDPAFRTCSQVRVVRLAGVAISAWVELRQLSETLTTEWSDRSVDWFDEDTLPVKLQHPISRQTQWVLGSGSVSYLIATLAV